MSTWRSRAGHFVASAVRRRRLRGYETGRGVCESCGDGRDGRGEGPRRFRFPTQRGTLPRYEMVRASEIVACRFHRREAEREAAKGPSWALVEIDRGPGPNRPQVGYES